MACKWLNNMFLADENTPIWICEGYFKIVNEKVCSKCKDYREGEGLHYVKRKEE